MAKRMKSWVEVAPRSHFSIYNIPFGCITSGQLHKPHIAMAIGEYVLDLHRFSQGAGWVGPVLKYSQVFYEETLNAFAALGRPAHRVIREYLQHILLDDGPYRKILQDNADLRKKALIPMTSCRMHLPMKIGDYTDFYAGLNHAFNVGVLFRGRDNALQPNYTHLPVGYHGRASSIVVSGTMIRRPTGQIPVDPTAATKVPMLAPCKNLDFELEIACFVCKPSIMGDPIPVDQASQYLFGVVLMNDWSARDIQAWEYVPLGPFNSKNFGTTISPWVVLMDALEPFAAEGIPNDTQVLSYLDEKGRKSHYDIDLSVSISPGRDGSLPAMVTRTSARNLLFSFPQMLAHHTIGGCPFNVGDLMGSGTISGTVEGTKGSLLELSSNGKVDIELPQGGRPKKIRRFLEDWDIVTFSGVCGDEDGALVGFGECEGQIVPALDSYALESRGIGLGRSTETVSLRTTSKMMDPPGRTMK